MTWGGALGNDLETWSNTVRWKTIGPDPTAGQLLLAAEALAAPLTAWLTDTGSRIQNSARLDYVKLNWINDTGLQRDVNTVQHDFVPGVRSGQFQPVPPFYQTAAITLRTRLHRGRTHAGRVFPPLVLYLPAADGSPYMNSDAARLMAQSFRDLLFASRAAMDLAWGDAISAPDPAIFSPGNPARGQVPLWSPIISTVVDCVPDVQHRRTKSIARLEGPTILLDPAV